MRRGAGIAAFLVGATALAQPPRVTVHARISLDDGDWHDYDVTFDTDARARYACMRFVDSVLATLRSAGASPRTLRACDGAPLPPRARGPYELVTVERDLHYLASSDARAAQLVVARTTYSREDSVEKCEAMRKLAGAGECRAVAATGPVTVHARIGNGDGTDPAWWTDLDATADTDDAARDACKAAVAHELGVGLPAAVAPVLMRGCDVAPLPSRMQGPVQLVSAATVEDLALMGVDADGAHVECTRVSRFATIEACESVRATLRAKAAQAGDDAHAQAQQWLDDQIEDLEHKAVDDCDGRSARACKADRAMIAALRKRRDEAPAPSAPGVAQECRAVATGKEVSPARK